MTSKPTPPCVRALDADGSEFWMDARGLAWRADSSRVPGLDGPSMAGTDIRLCSMCHGQTYLGRIGVDERTCHVCSGNGLEPRAQPTPPSGAPLDRAEVVAVLVAEYGRCGDVCYTEATQTNREACIAVVASHLGLRAEFDAAVRGEVRP